MDLTPSQSGEIDRLIDEHGEGKVEPGENGTMTFRALDRAWSIGSRGKVTELDLSDSGARESLGGPDQALDSGVDNASESHSSDGSESAGLQADSTTDQESGTPPDEQATPDLPTSSGSGALVPIAPSEQGNDPSGVVGPDPSELAADNRSDAYRAMSKADERQVAMELQGNAPKAAVYAFPQGGQQVVGLSWKGVREVVRTFNARGLGQIKVDGSKPPVFENVMVRAEIGKNSDGIIYGEVPGVRVTVYAIDDQYGGGNWGTATATCDQVNKKKASPDGHYTWQPDTFAATKALSKAQRNALEPLIPLELVEELKQLYMGQGAVEYIPGSGRETTPDLPPALTDDRAVTQMDRCRELYSEWGKLGGKQKMPPALFNRSMEAVQHSHDRLDDFTKHLESELKAAQDA